MTKLADVLWDAANKRLWDGYTHVGGKTCSCHAAYESADPAFWRCCGPINRFFSELGCDCYQSHFKEFREGPRRQGVRYIWLLLAMHVAEDEGIEI